MRVLVCGGRDYTDTDHVHNTLCEIDARRGPISHVIHGAATGADNEGMLWAQLMADSGRTCVHAPFAAEWRRYGKMAGPMRNERMLVEGKPDLVVAFPGGRGTADCVRRARDFGIEVMEVAPRRNGIKAVIPANGEKT